MKLYKSRINKCFISLQKNDFFLAIILFWHLIYYRMITKGGDNIIKIQKCEAQDGTPYTIQYQMSDLMFQQYQGLSEDLYEVDVQQMVLFEKQLDNPLPWYKKVAANLLQIKPQHQFLFFQTKKCLITIDFYQDNRIKVSMGDVKNVLKSGISHKRQHARVVKQKGQLQWRRHFKNGQLLVRDLIQHLQKTKIQKGYSQAFYNGSHFSHHMWNCMIKVSQNK